MSTDEVEVAPEPEKSLTFSVGTRRYRATKEIADAPPSRAEVAVVIAHMRLLTTSIRATLALIPSVHSEDLRESTRKNLLETHEELEELTVRLLGGVEIEE